LTAESEVPPRNLKDCAAKMASVRQSVCCEQRNRSRGSPLSNQCRALRLRPRLPRPSRARPPAPRSPCPSRRRSDKCLGDVSDRGGDSGDGNDLHCGGIASLDVLDLGNHGEVDRLDEQHEREEQREQLVELLWVLDDDHNYSECLDSVVELIDEQQW
jgi:hypothetical protein